MTYLRFVDSQTFFFLLRTLFSVFKGAGDPTLFHFLSTPLIFVLFVLDSASKLKTYSVVFLVLEGWELQAFVLQKLRGGVF